MNPKPHMTLPPPLWLHANGWNYIPGLIHGFSTRIENRIHTIANLQGPHGEMCTLKQVHGDEIIVVSQKIHRDIPVEADGMVTIESGRLLAIATADCVPVLMVAPEKRAVAALHAGWRGTLKGITAQAVGQLMDLWEVQPQEVWVAIGPAIDPCCYEVGREVGEALYEKWGKANPETWKLRGEKGFLDLRGINQAQCEQAGIPREQVQVVGPCTYCDSSRFTSYRREGTQAGRQLSVIGWQAAQEC